MPISVKVNNQLVQIKEVILKQGGTLIRKVPLKAKVNGMIIDFISYGPTQEEIKMLIEVQPEGFDAEVLSRIVNSMNDTVETVVITFSSGTFLCNNAVEIRRSNVTLVGQGGNTIIKANTRMYNLIYFNGLVDSIIENLNVFNMTLDGNGIITNANLYINKAGYSYYNPNDSYTPGINTVGSNCKKGVTVKNCVIKNSDSDGIYSGTGNNMVVSDNILLTNGTGIRVSSSSNIISNNIIRDNKYSGINITSRHNIISYNVAQNNGNHGINISSGGENIISSNEIRDSLSDGIYISCDNNTISSNTVVNSKYNGIYLHSCNSNNLSSNVISYNSGHGVVIFTGTNKGSSKNIVSNNNITNNNIGIFLSSVDNNNMNNIIQSNVIKSNSSAITDGGIGTMISHNQS